MSRDAKEIICPFYKDETNDSIRCEGYISDTCLNTFNDISRKTKHRESYCKTFDYFKCILADSLIEKYEE